MVGFNNWFNSNHTAYGSHSLRIFTSQAAMLPHGCQAVADVIPRHYATEEHIARILARLGRAEAARFISEKLPTTSKIRSGDLGEILATEFIAEETEFGVPLKRLRWKDHRNMAMRGEDVIGIAQHPITGRLEFLKTESKSRAALAAQVVAEARSALDKDNGLPSAHALTFISERLLELGQNALADAIDDALLHHGIPTQSVKHLLFIFSGNNPATHLSNSLQTYPGAIRQLSVGVRISTHADFIKDVYNLVITNANNN